MKRTILVAVMVVAMLVSVVAYASAVGVVTVNAKTGAKITLTMADVAWTAVGAVPGYLAPGESATLNTSVGVQSNKDYNIQTTVALGSLPGIGQGTSLSGTILPATAYGKTANAPVFTADTLTLTMGWADLDSTGTGSVTYTATQVP